MSSLLPSRVSAYVNKFDIFEKISNLIEDVEKTTLKTSGNNLPVDNIWDDIVMSNHFHSFRVWISVGS